MRRALPTLAAAIVATLIVALLMMTSCASPPPPAPAPAEAPPAAVPEAPRSEPAAVGTVRVTSATLNVRRDPTTAGEVVAQVKRGERLALLANRGEWSNVRLADGATGWVSSKLVSSDTASSTGTTPRRRGGCPPDAEFHFIQAPLPAFSDNAAAHGTVTVEVNVDTRGIVTSTRVTANTTGDPSLATLAEREIRNAKFAPPVKGCVPKAFIYTYKRDF